MAEFRNPYSGRPDYTFWRRSVSSDGQNTDPVTNPKFTITRSASVATVGSCFAQHISRQLKHNGYSFLVTENFQGAPGTVDENYGVYPARFGNVYTARQLLQLFRRAYGLLSPNEAIWSTVSGTMIDPFRPAIQERGFVSEDAIVDDLRTHLAATRRMFEDCEVFIFTLGLTEAWANASDGIVVPLAPSVVRVAETRFPYHFVNFTYDDVVTDINAFLDAFRSVNSRAKVMLTVSPVPLIATFEDRHVLVSNTASKSILRAAVDAIVRRSPDVEYFPSYEIITGPNSRGHFFNDDFREVNEEGVRTVMSIFQKHYFSGSDQSIELSQEDEARFTAMASVICDEERISR